MMTRILAKGYLWLLLALLYSPILIIMIFSFTEAKVLGNWTGFSTKLYSSLFTGGMHHSLMSAIGNTFVIALIAATASTLLGSFAAIGIFNLRQRTRQVMNFANAIPMMNADIITGVSLFLLLSVSAYRRALRRWYWRISPSVPPTWFSASCHG